MAKIAIKSEKLTPFGGFFSIMEQFDSMLSPILSTRHLVRDAAVLPPLSILWYSTEKSCSAEYTRGSADSKCQFFLI